MKRIKTIETRDLNKSVKTGGCGECQPGEVFRPLACGAFRYSQQYGYEKKSGSRTVTSRFSYQRGAAISIGEIPGD